MSRKLRSPKSVHGFSLIELMVAMGVFLIVGGAAISLVRRHMPLFNTAQNQTQMNMALRNAVAQLQMEVVNAGTGFSGVGAVAFSPFGATISKAANPACRATATYGPTCFDSFKLLQVDSTLPILTPSADIAAKTGVDTSIDAVMFLTIPGNPAAATPAQYAAWAASLTKGSELLFVQGGTEAPNLAGQPAIAIVVLTADAVPIGNSVQLTFAGAPTTAGGTPIAGSDPLNIYDAAENARFTNSFTSPGVDYVVRLVAGTTYSIDASNPNNPKMIRTDVAGNQDVIAEQIIGFTVGAWSSNITSGPLTVGAPTVPVSGYTVNPNDYNKDWTSIRSLQVQIVARATPNSDNPGTFQNAYDLGPYQVQGMSVVINPRNLNTN
ncbi:MAG TPA: prepilin-type N-terminal cleavage/methylation domain-containing protein [Candidatus Angelobacter sp.]